MSKDIELEIENILTELNSLSQTVAKKEQELSRINSVFLSQVGSSSYELAINGKAFLSELSDLEFLIEQMNDLGIFEGS